MDAKELIEKAWDQRKRGRFEEAAISAKAATLQDPADADGWWLLALNSYSLGEKVAALAAVRVTTERAPHFAAGWATRGSWELEEGADSDAERSFKAALEHVENEPAALRGLVRIYEKIDADKSDKSVEEIHVLTKLDELEGLNSWRLNRLGILHYRNNHGFEAIKYWVRNVHGNIDTASMANLGLAYNMDDVSQDVDAIDCWRMVLRMDGSHKLASHLILDNMPRLLELARKVRASRASMCLPEDQWYAAYLNPFQLLNCPEGFDFDDIEPKIVQKWKKTLLQEIELEEGKLDWIPGLVVDRSKAIELSEKLSDIETAQFHWQVYKCKPLLEFLSKGDISHFLIDEERSPLDLIAFVGASEGFREWLSEPFSAQYARIFTKSIAARDVLAIEALLDGRRWVLPSFSDRCFENALREAETILAPLRELKERAETSKVSAYEIDTILARNKIVSILNLLPPYFRHMQNEAVGLVRSIAIDSHNVHDDSDSSLAILEKSKAFSFKSIDLTERLKEDFDTISEMLRKQKEHEAHLRFGDGKAWKITKEGIQVDAELCPSNEIRALRWGILVQENRSQNYLFAAKRITGKEYLVTWTSNDHKEQEELFQKLVTAAFHYLIPSLMQNLKADLKLGSTLTVGPVQVTQDGFSFETKGFIFTSKVQVPWSRADVSHSNGNVIVGDKYSGKKCEPIALRKVANAPLLHLFQMSSNRD